VSRPAAGRTGGRSAAQGPGRTARGTTVAAALAGVLTELIRAPDLRVRLGGAGRRRVLSGFGADAGLDHLADRLRTELGPASPAAA
jgi:hypothetical protein